MYAMFIKIKHTQSVDNCLIVFVYIDDKHGDGLINTIQINVLVCLYY